MAVSVRALRRPGTVSEKKKRTLRQMSQKAWTWPGKNPRSVKQTLMSKSQLQPAVWPCHHAEMEKEPVVRTSSNQASSADEGKLT